MRRLHRGRQAAARAVGLPAWRGTAATGAVLAVLASGPVLSYPPGTHPAGHPVTAPATAPSTASATFGRIILPDLLLIAPQGLTAGQVARIARLPGVQNSIAVDGASIKLGGRQVNVLGVSARQFRPWTPLRTAADQRLWNALGDGTFVASAAVSRRLRLRGGQSYPLAGATRENLAFGGAAPLGVAGVDALVGPAAAARLGLIPDVAALISAPGLSMRALRAEVGAVLRGSAARMITLRAQQLPVDSPATAGRPASYLTLFRASAAAYCPGLSWTVLAAIGQIESGDGSNVGPSSAGALGPMQFLPSTWSQWGITGFGEPGPPNVMDPYDAVPSAARYLCAAGAATPGGLRGAIYAYNHAGWYVAEVLALAAEYARAYG